jgi:hypothetical protein
METREIVKILEAAVYDCTKEDGWANLAEVGVILREKAVPYGKLSKFIARFPDIIEIRIDDTRQPPVAYARLIES